MKNFLKLLLKNNYIWKRDISESLASSIIEIIDFFKGEENLNDPLNIIISFVEILLIILIGIVTMIYEEIIIINICGLNKDLKKEDYQREVNDILDITSEDDKLGKTYTSLNTLHPHSSSKSWMISMPLYKIFLFY